MGGLIKLSKPAMPDKLEPKGGSHVIESSTPGDAEIDPNAGMRQGNVNFRETIMGRFIEPEKPKPVLPPKVSKPKIIINLGDIEVG